MRRAAGRERMAGRAGMATLAERVAVNPLLIVSRRLGHASPAVSRRGADEEVQDISRPLTVFDR
jgi:hypothetical protein